MSIVTRNDRRPAAVRHWEVRGTVQGVGFRPFVHRLATSLDLAGSVRNDGGTVVIDAVGDPGDLDEFLLRLRQDAPPLAAVAEIVECEPSAAAVVEPAGVFAILPSADGADAPRFAEIPPDAAICDACFAELLDPDDRRYRYPFVNCTDCGPRATIIDDLPYDRSRTSMAGFPLCADCAAEYQDPSNRRFHAEPVACPECGPHLAWHTSEDDAAVTGPPALAYALARLRSGGIVAVKGLGGYQLVCDAGDEDAVRQLRAVKQRSHKPFAVMAAEVADVRAVACVTSAEERLLTSTARPIVLLRPWPGRHPHIAEGVAPAAPRLGLFLPTTPLHHLLLRGVGRPLVVTSGNIADAPIITDDAEAAEVLGPLCDGVLSHDRPIRARHDDSVARVVRDRPSLIRRARGYAPAAIDLPVPATRPILAVGAQLKHTFTLAAGKHAVVAPHTGDLSDADALAAFEESVTRMGRIHRVVPELVVHDLHPDYLSTQYAMRYANTRTADRRMAVQHHHAHIASCAAEHSVTGPVLGVAYDGLGLGDDGTMWGGEILLADLTSYRRVARFGRAPMPGGSAAVRKPLRMALGYLFAGEPLGGNRPSRHLLSEFCARLDGRENSVGTVVRLARTGLNSPSASSAGRLFDAAAAILGLCDEATYEGEAAVALEAAAADVHADLLPWRVLHHRPDGLWVFDTLDLLTGLIEGVESGASVATLAAGFHGAVASATVDLVRRCAKDTGVRTVCLSGGVWQNQRLLEAVGTRLHEDGFRVLTNSRVPPNDGGISFGQAAIAAARTADR